MSHQTEFSAVDQPIDLDDATADHSISQLVSHLRGAYRYSDFTKVEDILTRREVRIAAAGSEEVEGLKGEVIRAERRAEVGEGRAREAKEFVAGRMRKMRVRVRGMKERNARLREEVEALRKRGEERERRVEDLERRNGEMATWILELQKQLEKLVGEAGAWLDRSAKGVTGVGGGAELSNNARKGAECDSAGRADDGVSSGGAECGDLGMKGPSSIRSSDTDPKLNDIPLQPGDETGVQSSLPDDKHKKTLHSLSVRKTKKDFLSSFFKKSG